MGKSAVIPVLLAALCGSVLAGTVDRIERADTEAKVEVLARKILPRISAGRDSYMRIEALAEAFERVGRPDRGLDIIRQKIHKFDADAQDCLRDLQAKMLLRAGLFDRALAVAKARLRAAKSHQAKWIAHQQIALCLDKKKDWAGALEHYLFERGNTRCGTCNDALSHIRVLSLARCRFFSGDVDGALTGLATAIAPAEGTEDPRTGAEVFYCDYSARAGRSEAARTFIALRPEKQRAEMMLQMDLAEAFVAGDTKRVVSIFEDPENRSDLPWYWAAARFLELGQEGIAAVAARIGAGSEVMILVANRMECVDLLPAIEERLWTETDRHLRRNLESARADIAEAGGYRGRLAADLARAQAQVNGLAAAARKFRSVTGRWPQRLTELTRPVEGHPDGILTKIPRDPWGWPYSYGRPADADGTPRFRCRGPDRRTGTGDDLTHP